MKLILLNSNTTLNVVQFNSTAIAFNTDFTVNIQATTPELLGGVSNALITLNTDEGSELLRGIITEFSYYVSHLKGYCYHFIVQSLLFPFSVDLHTRVYRNMTAEDILRKVLVSAKFTLNVDLKDTLPVLPQIVQYKETDLTFVLRLMSYYGLLGKFEVKGKTCVYRIADRLSAFDIGACPNFPYAPHSKAHAAPVMFSYLQKTELKPTNFVFTEFDAMNPQALFILETTSNSPLPSRGEIRVHGLGRFESDIRQRLAQTWQAALDASRTHLTVTIDDPCIFLGNALTFSGNRAGPTPAKKYRLIEQTHRYDKEGYRQTSRLHPVSEPYYTLPIVSPVSAGILTASVHSKNDGNNPYDEYGRYNVIFDVDENKSPSLLLHALQPSVGSTGGFHFPYRAETEVLVQSFGNDAQNPVILGAMHQDNQQSLVTSENAGQHILTSKGNQTLLMDDDNAVFSLNDLSSSFLMDASDAPTMALSTEGLMKLSANSGILEKVKANSTYSVSKDHAQTVQDSVNKVSHHHQEASGQNMTKKMSHMELRSEKNIDLKTGERFALSAKSAQLEGDELLLFTEQGTLSVHSSSGLKLSSGKGVSISQAGASFSMDNAGNAEIIGKHTITLNFSDASLQGEKVYLGGGSSLNAELPTKPTLKKEPVLIIDAVPYDQKNTQQEDDWDYLIGVETALWHGVQSVGESLILGIDETGDMIGVSGYDRMTGAWGANWEMAQFLANLVKYGVKEANPLYQLISTILGDYYALFPQCAVEQLAKQAGYVIAYESGRVLIGKNVLTYLVETTAKKILNAVLSSSAFVQLSDNLASEEVSGSTGIGFIISIILAEGVVKQSQDAANRLKIQNLQIYEELTSKHLISGYFLIEKPMSNYLDAYQKNRQDNKGFLNNSRKRYCSGDNNAL